MSLLRPALALIIVASPVLAQNTPPTPWAREVVKSATLGGERPVFVATPENYRQNTQRYPVLVILDADDRAQFTLALANVNFLASRNAIPALIVVGIPNGRDRTHDLTPVASGKTAKDFPTAGGASVFADFIVDEVMPVVRSKYRTMNTTILAGHSFGGLFALEVAAKRPGVFAGIIAMSPALWWNDSTDVVSFSDDIGKSTVIQRLFATSGGLEPQIDVTTRRFASRLDSLKPAATAFAYRHYPDDDHGLTPAPSLADGLRFVFEPISMAKLPIAQLGPTADSAMVVNAVVETESSYARGAKSLGLPDRLPEPVLNQLGYNVLLGLKKPALAAWVFQRNVTLYPASANVYDSLGDGLLAKGDSSAAKTQFRKAVAIATKEGLPSAAESQKKLTQLERPAASAKPHSH